jgi:hypothetical protein
VYKVRNVFSDRIEAMKVLLPNLGGDTELAEREDCYLSPFLYRLMLKTGALAN